MDPLEKYLADTFGLPLADFCIVTGKLSDGTHVAVCCPVGWLTSHVDFGMLHPMNVLHGASAVRYLESLAGGHKVPGGTSARRPAPFVPSVN